MPGTGPLGKQASLAISSAVVTLTLPTGQPRANAALITVETNSIRFWVDGSTPTASDGHLVATGGTIELCDEAEVRLFKAIRASADATVQVTFYGDWKP